MMSRYDDVINVIELKLIKLMNDSDRVDRSVGCCEKFKSPIFAGWCPQIANEQMSILDFFEKLLSLEIQSGEELQIAASSKVSGLPQGMHFENFDFPYQPQPSEENCKIDHLSICANYAFIRNHENVLFFGSAGVVESIVNPGYPFLYFFRKGGRCGQKEETYHA